MKNVIVYLSVIIFIVSCVPSTKFHKAQTEIQSLQKAITISNAYSDSIRENYIAVKSDYNNLTYDFDESQKYASFSDRDLLKELNKEKIEGKKNYDLVRQFQANSEFTYGRSILRAQTFSSDAKCILKPYSNNNFLLINNNIITLDIEEMLSLSIEKQSELKRSLQELFYSLPNRNDIKISVSLYQSGVNSNWSKVKMQQELLSFLIYEASIPAQKVIGITKFITKEKSLEFGISTDSRIYLELEFNG